MTSIRTEAKCPLWVKTHVQRKRSRPLYPHNSGRVRCTCSSALCQYQTTTKSIFDLDLLHSEGRMVTMALVKTELEPPHLQRNADDFAVVRSIAESGERWPRIDAKHEPVFVGVGFPGSWRLSSNIFLGWVIFWKVPVRNCSGDFQFWGRQSAIRRSTRSSPVGIRCTKYFSISTRRRALRKTSV